MPTPRPPVSRQTYAGFSSRMIFAIQPAISMVERLAPPLNLGYGVPTPPGERRCIVSLPCGINPDQERTGRLDICGLACRHHGLGLRLITCLWTFGTPSIYQSKLRIARTRRFGRPDVFCTEAAFLMPSAVRHLLPCNQRHLPPIRAEVYRLSDAEWRRSETPRITARLMSATPSTAARKRT